MFRVSGLGFVKHVTRLSEVSLLHRCYGTAALVAPITRTSTL